MPLQWATTQNNLGQTLLVLFERNPDPGLLDEAEAAITDARQIFLVKAGQTQHTAYFDASWPGYPRCEPNPSPFADPPPSCRYQGGCPWSALRWVVGL